MKERNYKRLCYSERITIQTLLDEGKTKTYIAKKLKRSRSTITREIKKWVVKPWEKYHADIAQLWSNEEKLSKRNYDKLSQYPSLKLQVYKGLLCKLSPETISGRLKLAYPNQVSMNISHETIYQHIYAHRQAKLNKRLIQCLTRKKSIRRRPNARTKHGPVIKEGTSIDLRPIVIASRQTIGHWEGDLVVGPKSQSCIGTIVERKTRYTLIIKLENKKSAHVREAFENAINKLPIEYKLSMTYDNGTEMAQHRELTENTGLSVYFAHPYSSWERGTNENTNGIIRRFYPKKTDFNSITAEELSQLQNHMNNRPRKVLGFYTPNEVFQSELMKSKNDHNDAKVLKTGENLRFSSALMPLNINNRN